MEYLINVGLGFIPALTIGIVLYLFAVVILKNIKIKQLKGVNVTYYANRALGLFLAANLAITMMNPSITYKHQPFDQEREAQKVEQLNAAKHSKGNDLVIKDDAKPIVGVPDEEFDNLVEFNNDGRDE
jgi:hypothetical protein